MKDIKEKVCHAASSYETNRMRWEIELDTFNKLSNRMVDCRELYPSDRDPASGMLEAVFQITEEL